MDTKLKEGESPYLTFGGNPIANTDVNGDVSSGPNDEFDKNGKKISNLGGNKINFFHQQDGSTKIVDVATGASNVIKGGEKAIIGYTLRDKNVGWSKMTTEFLFGNGPTNSLFADFDNTKDGALGSLHNTYSSYSSLARENSLNTTELKNTIKMNYGNANPLFAKDMWEQMWGRSNVSWYELGNKTLFMMQDSKSATSLFYRLSGNWERNSGKKMGNTRQTYIWIETNTDIQNKVSEKITHDQNEFKKILDESKRMLPGKI